MTQPASQDIGAEGGFLFRRPEIHADISDAAKLAIEMGAIASRLVREERTLCIHPDGRAENVAEHSFMLAKVAPELARLMYPDLDPNLVARFASVHDDVEAYVGDTPTHEISAEGQIAKAELEKRGLQQLKRDYAHIPSYVQLVEDYEAQEIPEARFVRVVDKLMVLLIHIPNEGEAIRDIHTYDSLMANARKKTEELIAEYPEFADVAELRLELSRYVAANYLINGQETVQKASKTV